MLWPSLEPAPGSSSVPCACDVSIHTDEQDRGGHSSPLCTLCTLHGTIWGQRQDGLDGGVAGSRVVSFGPIHLREALLPASTFPNTAFSPHAAGRHRALSLLFSQDLETAVTSVAFVPCERIFWVVSPDQPPPNCPLNNLKNSALEGQLHSQNPGLKWAQ